MPLKAAALHHGFLKPALWLLGAAAVLIFLVNAGRLLVVNHPEPSDVIVVLNGGTWARTLGGLSWLRRGEAPRLILDVDAHSQDWGVPESTLARQWIDHLPPPLPARVSVCATSALSTRAEAELDQRCLAGARTVLIVTSAYHTRRALATFSRIDGTRRYTAAAVDEPRYFGVAWWRHREWAKTTVQEWAKLLWWEAVDRWR